MKLQASVKVDQMTKKLENLQEEYYDKSRYVCVFYFVIKVSKEKLKFLCRLNIKQYENTQIKNNRNSLDIEKLSSLDLQSILEFP